MVPETPDPRGPQQAPGWSWHLLLVASAESAPAGYKASVRHADTPVGSRVTVMTVPDQDDIPSCREAVRRTLCEAGWIHGATAADAVVFLAGPGTQHMQLGGLLAAAEVATNAGAPLLVGAMTHRRKGGGTDVKAEPGTVALFPGWDGTLRPTIVALLKELEFDAAIDVARSLGQRGEVLAFDLQTLKQASTEDVTEAHEAREKSQARAAQRVALVARALADADPHLALAWTVAVLELTLGPHPKDCDVSHCQWARDGDHIQSLLALKGVRSSSIISHGDVFNVDRQVEKEARDRRMQDVRSLDILLDRAVSDLSPGPCTGDLISQWEMLLTRAEGSRAPDGAS